MTDSSDRRKKIAAETAISYNQLADEYESRWTDYLAHTHQKFLERFSLVDGEIVLDLSCGTGLLTQKILHRGDNFQEIILNDIAEKLQAQAKQRFSGHENIRFTAYAVEKLPFLNQKFDKILCLSAFHNYDQQAKVLAECYRILRPGGHFYVLDWNRSGLFRIKNWFIKQSGTEYINTKSVREMHKLLHRQNFTITHKESWYHGWWKFFYLIGQKPT